MDQHTSLYQCLGVKQDTSMTDIRQAYRSLAQRHHPDKGGSTDEWQQIQLAYDVLSSPERRSRYDKTGLTDLPDGAAAMNGELVNCMMAVVDGCPDPHTEDLVGSAIRVLRDVQQKRYELIDDMKKQVKRREIAIRRLPQELAQLLEGDVRLRRAGIHQMEEQRQIGAKALALLSRLSDVKVRELRSVGA